MNRACRRLGAVAAVISPVLLGAAPASARQSSAAAPGVTDHGSSSVDVGQLWEGQVLGHRNTDLSDRTLHEPSGLASSRINHDIVYIHSESDVHGMVAVSTTNARVAGRYDVAIPQQWDWEDIATGPCPAGSCIYAGDIGLDNGKANAPSTFAVYRVPEPNLIQGQTGGTLIGDWFRFQYPDGPHNAEALMVHPISGRIYVITKSPDGRSGVYAFPAVLPPPSDTAVTTLEMVATLAIPTWTGDPADTHAAEWFAQVTAGAIHPSGDRFLIRTPYKVYEYRAPSADRFDSAFAATPVELTTPTGEGQGEAIDYSWDGSAYYTISEHDEPPYVLKRVGSPTAAGRRQALATPSPRSIDELRPDVHVPPTNARPSTVASFRVTVAA